MKTPLLFVLALAVGVSVSAQKISKAQSKNVDSNAKLEKARIADDVTNTKVYKPNYAPVVKSLKTAPGVSETLIGGTIYDTQTNAAVDNRCYVYPDGTVAAVWTLGFDPTAYALRGTGYNFFNGSTWGDEPTARIESMRTGWPSYCPLGNGEAVISHNGATGLQLSKRPVRGTGAWSTSLLPGPTGFAGITWPRMVSNGNSLHVIVCSGTGTYQGLDVALLYYRSTNGGTTWDAPVIIPGLDATSLGAGAGKSFSGFGGDAYAWAPPKGDTIAFVVDEPMAGMWIMKSFNNGTTWTKTTVKTIPNFTVAPTPILGSTDGSVSLALDSHGKAHLIVGRMRVSDADFVAAGNSYYPYTDGLLYWTEGMPVLDTTALQNWDGLVASGNLISGMLDYSGNDSIDFPTVASGFPFGLYGLGLTSMGQITIDEHDNIFVTYSSCREDLINAGANPNVEIYRHLYTMSKMAGQTTWSDPIDLTDDIEHSYDECVTASLAPKAVQGKLHMIYHVDPEPGTAVGSDADTPSDTYVNYLTFPTFVKVKQVDIAKYVEVSPNPAQDHANVVVSLTASNKVELSVYDVMGKLVLNNNYGQQATGYHTYEINTSNLPGGMYLFTVKIGNSQTSKKVVVK